MAKEHLATQKRLLKEQKAIAKQVIGNLPSWNRQLILDIEANIRKTEGDIDLIARRLGHR